MPQLFVNNASTTINGSLSEGATTLVLLATTGAQFPAPAGGDFFLGTLYEKDLNGADTRVEIVKVTARTADTLTIERDFESMTGSSGGYAYPSEAGKTVYFDLRWTAYAAGNVLQKAENLADLPDAAAARANLGVTALLDGKADSAHAHTISNVAGLQTALDGKAAATHHHSGVYEPVDPTILRDADIGVAVQAYDADLLAWAGIAPSAKQNALVSGTTLKTVNGVSLLGAGNLVTDPGTVTAVGALNIDCALGAYFTKTISANSTFTFSNVPAAKAYAFTLELTHTSGTVTWPTTVKWPGDTAPSLTDGKTHLFVFVTDDGGARWRGVANTNYVN